MPGSVPARLRAPHSVPDVPCSFRRSWCARAPRDLPADLWCTQCLVSGFFVVDGLAFLLSTTKKPGAPGSSQVLFICSKRSSSGEGLIEVMKYPAPVRVSRRTTEAPGIILQSPRSPRNRYAPGRSGHRDNPKHRNPGMPEMIGVASPEDAPSRGGCLRGSDRQHCVLQDHVSRSFQG